MYHFFYSSGQARTLFKDCTAALVFVTSAWEANKAPFLEFSDEDAFKQVFRISLALTSESTLRLNLYDPHD